MTYRTIDYNDNFYSRFRNGTYVRLSYPFIGNDVEKYSALKYLDIDRDYVIQDVYITRQEIFVWLYGFDYIHFNGLQFTLTSNDVISTPSTRRKFKLLKLYGRLKCCD